MAIRRVLFRSEGTQAADRSQPEFDFDDDATPKAAAKPAARHSVPEAAAVAAVAVATQSTTATDTAQTPEPAADKPEADKAPKPSQQEPTAAPPSVTTHTTAADDPDPANIGTAS